MSDKVIGVFMILLAAILVYGARHIGQGVDRFLIHAGSVIMVIVGLWSLFRSDKYE